MAQGDVNLNQQMVRILEFISSLREFWFMNPYNQMQYLFDWFNSINYLTDWFFFFGKAKEEEERLKYLEFVHVAALHALVTFTNLYLYAKDKSGPLKPGVETVEGTVKSVVGPVYDKFHDVPIELLKFVDRKVSPVSLRKWYWSYDYVDGFFFFFW